MAALRWRNAVILAEPEAVEGTPETPTAADNAILVENVRLAFNPQNIDTDEVAASLDPDAPIVGGMAAELGYDVYLKGSGAAGTAPEFGDLLESCGLLETVTGTAVPAAPEALAAGASAVQCTLGAGAAGTADLYNGMPIVFTSAVAGPSFIADYTAAKLATLTDTMSGNLTTTSNYQIPVNVRYQPHSGVIPSITQWMYVDGLLYKFFGMRGNMSLNLRSGGPGKMSFRFTGLFTSKTDAAIVTPTLDTTRPPIWRDASNDSYAAALVNRVLSGIANLNLDMGNQISYPDNPNAQDGFDPGVITRRRVTGSIDPIETLVATRDIMADFRAGTQRILHARLGGTAGNRIGITVPAAQYLNQSPGERGGLAAVDVPFFAANRDGGFQLTFY